MEGGLGRLPLTSSTGPGPRPTIPPAILHRRTDLSLRGFPTATPQGNTEADWVPTSGQGRRPEPDKSLVSFIGRFFHHQCRRAASIPRPTPRLIPEEIMKWEVLNIAAGLPSAAVGACLYPPQSLALRQSNEVKWVASSGVWSRRKWASPSRSGATMVKEHEPS